MTVFANHLTAKTWVAPDPGNVDMKRIKTWLTGATLAAAALRTAIAVAAALAANGDPVVALCAALAAEVGLVSEARL